MHDVGCSVVQEGPRRCACRTQGMMTMRALRGGAGMYNTMGSWVMQSSENNEYEYTCLGQGDSMSAWCEMHAAPTHLGWCR